MALERKNLVGDGLVFFCLYEIKQKNKQETKKTKIKLACLQPFQKRFKYRVCSVVLSCVKRCCGMPRFYHAQLTRLSARLG